MRFLNQNLKVFWHLLCIQSTFDLCTLYTTLHNDLIKEKTTAFIGQTFDRDVSFNSACNEKCTFFTSEQQKNTIICDFQMLL